MCMFKGKGGWGEGEVPIKTQTPMTHTISARWHLDRGVVCAKGKRDTLFKKHSVSPHRATKKKSE